MMRQPSILHALAIALLGAAANPARAHVEYYDLNQGKQIINLTAQGLAASTAQYGANPTVAGSSANGVSDRPLNDVSLWTAQYQSASQVGQFSDVRYSAALSTATVLVNDVTDGGWGAGTHALQGDSHKVDFFNFRLPEAARVSIAWNVFDGANNFFDAGFSLYAGVLVYQGHDDANGDPLNPKTGFPPRRQQNALDAGGVSDAQNIAADFRNTRTNVSDWAGQFDALGNWGQANGAGNWSNIAFITAVNAHNPASGFAVNDAAATQETLVIELAAGNYTIAASGALGAQGFGNVAPSFGISGLNGRLEFRAAALSAVPVPPSIGLLAGALATLASVARMRRRR
ncbi:MAG: hypothetical protein IPM80_24270 [Proteobacteria bacterium]|nr:hypothetical protein [Pseudomonadota bacterium]